ncbi:response regulator [Yoonia sp. BS5-3]|uniref:histidine kinase n=1 Tax=Yoonia phaeophyticola TaxID=3137369 RepID=A0ABZ2V924_9RHOB
MISVLLIDDSPEEQELVADLLQNGKSDVDVIGCFDGAGAMRHAKEQAFDCVLLDLRLDGEDGLDVLAKLREARPNLPVIVLTGQGNEQAATDAFLAGASYYLPKRDLTAATLWTAIDRVMEHTANQRELNTKRKALERSNRLDAVGQLAAGITHDFNNQLGALRYCIEFLKPTAVTDKAKQQIHTALKVIEESKNLAGRLVALSRNTDHAVNSAPLRATMADLRALAAASVAAQVMLDIAEPEDLVACCDPGQLLNVLLNLVLNADDAIRATGGIGTISVRVTQEDDMLHIRLRDNGCGMSPDVMARCSDPFFTTKQDRNGTGLGLAMAQSFVQDNNGKLLLQSEEGHGTEICLILPVGSKPTNIVDESTTTETAKPSNARILLVEDQSILAVMTKEIIAQDGYDVEMVMTGEAALTFIEAGAKLDLIITDIKMPGLDGLELARLVRAQHPTMKFIYLTGYTEKLDHHDEATLGPVLHKPVEPDALMVAIRSVLSAD